MSTVSAARLSPGSLEQQSQLEELQLEVLEPVLLATVLAAFGIQQYLSLIAGYSDTGAIAMTCSLLCSAGVAHWVRRFGPRNAACALVVGLTASVGVALSFRPSLGVAALFAPTVVLAGSLLGWKLASAAAFMATVETLVVLGPVVSVPPLDMVELGLAMRRGEPIDLIPTGVPYGTGGQ